MRTPLKILLCSLLLNTACVIPIPAPIPVPLPTPAVGVSIVLSSPVAGVHFIAGPTQCDSDGRGIAYCVPVPITATRLDIQSPAGYATVPFLPLTLHEGHNTEVTVVIIPTVLPLPSPPTRSQVLNVHLTFQGLTCTLPDRGTLPIFEAAIAWLSPVDRQALYACKHAVGDTHAIIAVPSGRPLYDEPGQPYDATHFPALDWTNNLTRMDPVFRALVEEEIRAGFIPLVFLDESDRTWTASLVPVLDALLHGDDGYDLTQYGMTLPGWDGIFYGKEPSHIVIPNWASVGRARCPTCYFGLEFNTGHIPLGEGDTDYQPGGLMRNFDALFVEFGGIHDNNTWGIIGRLLGPAYVRPADDTPTNNGHDSNPRPWYLRTPSLRGPWGVVCFEFGDDEFNWVRSRITAQTIQQHRDYLKAAGCSAIG